jgi:hypothetical protein
MLASYLLSPMKITETGYFCWTSLLPETFHQLDVCIVFLHLVRHHGYRLCGIRFHAAFPARVPIA